MLLCSRDADFSAPDGPGQRHWASKAALRRARDEGGDGWVGCPAGRTAGAGRPQRRRAAGAGRVQRRAGLAGPGGRHGVRRPPAGPARGRRRRRPRPPAGIGRGRRGRRRPVPRPGPGPGRGGPGPGAHGSWRRTGGRRPRRPGTTRSPGLADQHQARAVLLGHTRDDQAESVLLGLLRGSGARALSGMAARRGIYRRPLLGLDRATTIAACAEAGLDPWADPHNNDPAYARVRARALLGELEARLGAGVRAGLARSAELLRADDEALAAWAERRLRPSPDRRPGREATAARLPGTRRAAGRDPQPRPASGRPARRCAGGRPDLGPASPPSTPSSWAGTARDRWTCRAASTGSGTVAGSSSPGTRRARTARTPSRSPEE